MAPFGLKITVAMALVLAVAANSSPANAQQKIMIDGSTGTAPLVAALGKGFTAKHNVVVEVGKGLGTKARLEALSAGKIDLAMASHGLNVADITAMGMTVYRIAMTPVVFAVHETVRVDGLTDAQICTIYETPQRNWKDFGGPDLAIAPLTRPRARSTPRSRAAASDAMSTTSDAASATPTVSGRSPAVVSIRYWSASPAAVPPGSSFATAFSLS